MHFEQADGERGFVDVDDARRLAKLYGDKNMERIKKEDPVLHAALTKPLPSIKKTKESDDDEVESSTSKDDSSCIVN